MLPYRIHSIPIAFTIDEAEQHCRAAAMAALDSSLDSHPSDSSPKKPSAPAGETAEAETGHPTERPPPQDRDIPTGRHTKGSNRHRMSIYMYACMYAERCICSSQDERVQQEGICGLLRGPSQPSGKGPIMAACTIPILMGKILLRGILFREIFTIIYGHA